MESYRFMAKIASMHEARRRREEKRKTTLAECPHKDVIVFANDRSVRCAVCGATLDPFDVLVDLVQRYGPEA